MFNFLRLYYFIIRTISLDRAMREASIINRNFKGFMLYRTQGICLRHLPQQEQPCVNTI